MDDLEKLKIGVVAGEYPVKEISLKSGRAVHESLLCGFSSKLIDIKSQEKLKSSEAPIRTGSGVYYDSWQRR